MPFYKSLKNATKRDRDRTILGIERIREQLTQSNFPRKTSSETLILGTWNIRNFDDDRFNYGPRLNESLYYIAEIISRFDVIAVQEVCADLGPLNRLMSILGYKYDFILTDVTHSSLGGNQERLGFIYDRDKVKFRGVAGEIVLPARLLVEDGSALKRQFSRTPFGVEFQSNWFKFLFSTVHIYYGNNSVNSPEYARRVDEINKVAKYLAKEAKASEANHILVGDFNIIKPGSQGYDALAKNGFQMVRNKEGSNRDKTKFYDQISFLSRKNELQFVDPDRDDRVIHFFESVFRDEDFGVYEPIMLKMIEKKLAKAQKDLDAATSKTAKKKLNGQIQSLEDARATTASLREYYDEWRTFQMSDHMPLWVEIKVDFSGAYLEYLKTYKP